MQQKIHLKCYEKKRLGSLEIFHHKAILHFFFVCPNTYYVFRSICFSLSEIPIHVFTNNAGHLVNHAVLEDHVKDKVPGLKQFICKGKYISRV